MSCVTLPWPSSDLSPNVRAHWAAKAKATKEARRTAWALAQHLNAPDGDIPILVRFYPPNRRMDRANMPFLVKAYLDGIADALGVNDKRFNPIYAYGDPIKGGAVEVIIPSDGDWRSVGCAASGLIDEALDNTLKRNATASREA